MQRGRKPKPTAIRRAEGNPGKRGYNVDEPLPPDGLPDCPPHLGMEAQLEWDRLAETLWRMGVLTTVDRAALAAYCQSWGRWVEAEEKLKSTPMLLKTATGYVQQSPWLSIANKQLELMGRYMSELGITPAARSRVAALAMPVADDPVDKIAFVVVYTGEDGRRYERPVDGSGAPRLYEPDAEEEGRAPPILLDGRL
jgi:P27 family predicted phage terminase small subunit